MFSKTCLQLLSGSWLKLLIASRAYTLNSCLGAGKDLSIINLQEILDRNISNFKRCWSNKNRVSSRMSILYFVQNTLLALSQAMCTRQGRVNQKSVSTENVASQKKTKRPIKSGELDSDFLNWIFKYLLIGILPRSTKHYFRCSAKAVKSVGLICQWSTELALMLITIERLIRKKAMTERQGRW